MKIADYRVIWNPNTEDDLRGIHRYIARKMFMPKAADGLVEAIKKAGDDLCFSPYWPLVDDEELAKLGLRKMVVKNYIIFFIIKENVVSIERIIYGRRNWVKILRTMYGIETSP